MMDLEKYLDLVEQVRKPPEVGDPIIRQAELIQADAKAGRCNVPEPRSRVRRSLL